MLQIQFFQEQPDFRKVENQHLLTLEARSAFPRIIASFKSIIWLYEIENYAEPFKTYQKLTIIQVFMYPLDEPVNK